MDCRFRKALTGQSPPIFRRLPERWLDLLTPRRHDERMLIYKIFRREEWDAFRMAGRSLGAPIDLKDGFVHFSTAKQVAETAAKHFAGLSDLVLVAFDAEGFGVDLKWEVSRNQDLFPHLYRELRISDVVWDKSLPLGEAGHVFPKGAM